MAVTSSPISRNALSRVLQSLLTAELRKARGGVTHSTGSLAAITGVWPDALRIADNGLLALGCDSLEVMWLAAAANEMFHLYEAGHEADLLSAETFGAWLDVIEAGWRSGVTRLTFMTSGSTGVPKRCTHELSYLRAEIHYLAELFATRKRIITLVLAHHIYGFLFTAMLPDLLGLEVMAGERPSPGGLAQELRAGDLIVSIPDRWRWLNHTVMTWPRGVDGVVSTAPCPPALINSLMERGLHGMTEVYGSSETAGIATRAWPSSTYRLMQQWRHVSSIDPKDTALVHASEVQIQLMDRVHFFEDGSFVLAGRQDEAVQVGGTNVYPARIAALLRTRPDVADAEVRLMRPEEGTRLKAFIVAASEACVDNVHRELEAWIEVHLSPVERPKALTFGADLPKNAHGKAMDW